MIVARVEDLHHDMLRLADAQAVAAKHNKPELSYSLADLVEELAALARALEKQRGKP